MNISVFRIALVEHTFKVPDRNLYSRVFVIVWTWSVLVLAESYAGTLTAMITRPGLVRTIRNAEDLLNQGGNSIIASPPGGWKMNAFVGQELINTGMRA